MTASDERFCQFAESVGYVFWMYSAGLRQIHYVSPGYELIWGRSVESLYARPEQWNEAILPEDREQVFATFLKPTEESHGMAVFRILRPDGEIRWIEGRARPVLDAEENVLCIMGIAADVTERQQSEEEMTSALDNAIEALGEKSQFLATMSHEIRTPMSGVISMTRLLLETNLDREQRDMVETIRRGGEQLLTIINKILDFSKIDAGKMSLEMRDFDLQEVVEDTLDLLAKKAHSKGLEILGLVEPNVFTHLRGDAEEVGQILTNLLGNAVKFTERGEVFLRVSRQAGTATGTTLRFEVKDTGFGINAETRRYIFQPFRQAYSSTARKYGGTGLGLAIAKELVTMMNGEIGVESEPGQGSLFWFTAHFDKQAAPATGEMEKILIGLRVLVAVENPIGRQILQTKLRSLGMYPAAASDGDEVLAILKKAATEDIPFDLAILGWRLAKLNGLALAKAIKADPTIAATPLVALDSRSVLHDAAEFHAMGIEDVLVEPLRQSRLSGRLSAVMTRKVGAVSDSRPLPVAPEAGLPRHNPRILLAEDNPINQKVALLQLKKLGYHADAVADGHDVIEALKHTFYDIILMDCQMPDLDGYETTKRIRGDYLRPVYIIALTAHALQADREKCLSVGMDDYLTKPVLLTDLKVALERWHPGLSIDYR